ncbi:DUF3995 domain-containing protein [Nonomuraea dietziae]|uniref:DUF3995 domain-containing protein n=1 Tax=Nonomuraea dietziae TaxID=65515 RepID=A0A7W5VEI5_9ACTN|nr:DUF3995 domain-containing protein [Nonomuraea dietziae]MBB3733406.1 hypothetical protein [Nonomuraea dietziae]
MKRQTRARAAYAAATVLAVDAAAHLYWTTGAIWPAPDVRTLSLAVLNMEVPFTPRVLLPLAAALLTASAALITTTRLGALGAGVGGVASVGDRSVAAKGDDANGHSANGHSRVGNGGVGGLGGAGGTEVGAGDAGADGAGGDGVGALRVPDVDGGDGRGHGGADRGPGGADRQAGGADREAGGVRAGDLAGTALSGARGSGTAVRPVGSRHGWGARRMPGLMVARVVRLVTGVLALGVLARAVLGLVWTLGFGVQTSTPFYWLNALLYTPLCLALFVAVVVARGTAAPADGPARDHGVKIS